MGVERLYNSVELSSGSSWVWRPGEQLTYRSDGDRRDVVRKATSGRRGHLNPDGVDPSIRRTRKTQRDGHNSGVKMLQFMFDLQLPLTRKPWTTLSNPCNKVRGKILLKKSSCVFILRASLSFLRLCHYHACVCLFIIASVCIQHIYVYFCMNQQMTI